MITVVYDYLGFIKYLTAKNGIYHDNNLSTPHANIITKGYLGN